MTGALSKIDVTGVGGRTFAQAWSEGPKTYLGLGVPEFPNLFLVTGPGSPSVLTNMVTCEQVATAGYRGFHLGATTGDR